VQSAPPKKDSKKDRKKEAKKDPKRKTPESDEGDDVVVRISREQWDFYVKNR